MREVPPGDRLGRLIGTRTQARVAKDCGVEESNLSRYKKVGHSALEERGFSPSDAKRLADYFGIPVECLMGPVHEGLEILVRRARGATRREQVGWLLSEAHRVYGFKAKDWTDKSGICEDDMLLFFEKRMWISNEVLERILSCINLTADALGDSDGGKEYAPAIALARRWRISPNELCLLIERSAKS